MVLPIVVYGDPVLRKVAEKIDRNYPELDKLIKDMFDTMYNANGVGLAAPQIGKSIRLFVVDASPFGEKDEEDEDDELSLEERKKLQGFKKVFINAKILNEEGEEWAFSEGCLSIPKIRENVNRLPKIEIEYYDENFVKHCEVFDGVRARIIQHEYDHIEGRLFTDRISPFKRRLLSGKLNDIANGKITADYKTRVYKPKK
jgi:peptide deformylase